jgi:hypothetical protein
MFYEALCREEGVEGPCRLLSCPGDEVGLRRRVGTEEAQEAQVL